MLYFINGGDGFLLATNINPDEYLMRIKKKREEKTSPNIKKKSAVHSPSFLLPLRVYERKEKRII